MAEEKRCGLSVASLVTGIVGMIISWLPFIGLLAGTAALVLGIMANNKISKDNSLKGKGFAIAGIVLGSIAVVVGVLVLIIVITGFGILAPSHFASTKVHS